MSLLGALLLAAALDQPEILAVRAEVAGEATLVKILAASTIDAPVVERDGDVLRVSFEALAPSSLDLPEPTGALRSLEIERVPPRVVFRFDLAPDTPHDVQVSGSLVTIALGTLVAGPEAAAPVAEAPGDVEALYPKLFPPAPRDEAPAGMATGSGGVPVPGIKLTGSITFRPAIIIRYVDTYATFLDTPQPTRIRYWEFEPHLGTLGWPMVTIGSDKFSVSYSARLRKPTESVPLLDSVSHFVDASVNIPISFLVLSGAYHFSKATLETREVDPGGEYFFNLGRFQRNQGTLGLRTEFAGRLNLVASAYRNREKMLEVGTGWFPSNTEGVGGGLRYDLSASTTATLRYDYDRTLPPAERPVVESRAHTVSLGLSGELGLLVSGDLTVGYRWQENPQAPAPGNEFKGLTLSASLKKDFDQGTNLRVSVYRTTPMSAFEQNAFYVANGVAGVVTVPLPWSFAANGGLAYSVNHYRLPAAAIGEPREDSLFGWSVGLGRPITRWSHARLDYRRDRRTSNIPGYSNNTWAFIAELGVGFLGMPGR